MEIKNFKLISSFLKNNRIKRKIIIENLTEEQEIQLKNILNQKPFLKDYIDKNSLRDLIFILKNFDFKLITKDFLKCEICQKNYKIVKNSKLYHVCSNCLKNKEALKKLQIQKSKESIRKKYNVDYPFQSKEIKEKINKTFRKKYNGNPIFDIDIKNRQINNIKKIFELKKDEIINKRKITYKKLYNTDNPMKNKKIKEKRKKACIIKYNVDNPMKNEKIKEKLKEILRNKYKFTETGISSAKQIHLKNLDKLNKEFIEKNFLNENREFKLKEFQNYFGYSQSQAHYILKKLNIDYKKRLGTSSYEDEIIDYIKSLFK